MSADNTTSRVYMEKPHEYVAIWVTCPTTEVASAIARKVIEEKLAACVSLFPNIQSIYSWENKIQVETEQQLVIKTLASKIQPLAQKIQEWHPYEIPEFIVIPILGGTPQYLHWMEEIQT